jgi:hypothetical protein
MIRLTVKTSRHRGKGTTTGARDLSFIPIFHCGVVEVVISLSFTGTNIARKRCPSGTLPSSNENVASSLLFDESNTSFLVG